MKIKHGILLFALLAFVPIASTHAQQLSTLHSFSGPDGYVPETGLTQGADGNFYGVTQGGGDYGYGVAFRISPSGTYTVLHSFGQDSTDPQKPFGKLTPGNDGNFYGTTTHGGANDYGTIYKMTPDGTVTVLHSMAFADGVAPTAELHLGTDGSFYGTAPNGGSGSGPVGSGTIFKVNSVGTLTVLHSFTATFSNTNSDGQSPIGGLVEDIDGNLLGTTYGGGQFGLGTVFVITKSGTFTSLYSFGAQSGDGSFPRTGLVPADDGSFYGTCSQGGASNKGTLFKMTTSGTAASTNVQKVHTFSGVSGDGALPLSGLIEGNDGKLYGMTASGGANGNGLIYRLTFDGIFTTLYSFGAQTNDGAAPNDTLFQTSDGALYGTTSGGGTANAGTIFKFGAAVAVPPAHISVIYEGKIRDRVGQGDAALAADGTNDATFTVQLLTGSGSRQVTSLDINRGDGNEWDTVPGNGKWVAGASATFDSGLLNGSDGSVSFSFPEGATIELFAADNGDKFSGHTFTITVGFADGTTAAANVTLPSANALAPTTFTVNESNQPSYPPTGSTVNGLADTVLRFAAKQIGTPAGLIVRVQATTTPNVASSWTNLPTARGGRMSFGQDTNRFILNTTDYPTQQSDPVYFRAISTAQGQDPSVSNVVGPFNLTSNTQHLATRLNFIGGGSASDLYFWTNESAMPDGIAARIQASFTPSIESSWIDIKDEAGNNISGMTRSTGKENPNCFLLLIDKYPTSSGVYFRAIANAPGYVDSLSNVMGPFDIVRDTPPVVEIFPPDKLPGSGDGSAPDRPVYMNAGNSAFGAIAHSDRPVETIQMKVDGKTVQLFVPGKDANNNSLYTANFTVDVGPHVLEVRAFDDLGGTARVGTYTTYIHAVPPGSIGSAKRGARSTNGSTAATGSVFTAVQVGPWDYTGTWRDAAGNEGIPGPNDSVIIPAGVIVDVLSPKEVASLTLHGFLAGLPFPFFDLKVNHSMLVSDGAALTDLHLIINSGATCQLVNKDPVLFAGVVVDNYGTFSAHGSGSMFALASFTNYGWVDFPIPITVPSDAATNPLSVIRVIGANQVAHLGAVAGDISTIVTDAGAGLIGHDGGSLIGHDGGSLVSEHGNGLIGHDGGSLIGHDGGSLIGHDGGSLIGHDGGSLTIAGGLNLISANSGKFKAATTATSVTEETGFTQTGGAFDLSVASISGPVTLNAGVMNGSGVINGDLTNNGGFVAPGQQSPGTIAVTGNFSQAADGTIVIKRGGSMPAQFDQLQVDGTATLAGKLDVKTMNGYTPSASDTFDPLGYSSASGSLSASSNAQVTIAPTGVVASLDPAKPNPTTGQPLNISTRMQVLAGDNALIAGFIVTGPSGSSKKVLIRGLGPSLANFGVPGTINDPLLELHKADGTVVTNDNWQDGDTSEIPNGFSPSDPRESLIVATLSPGNYSAVLKGAHGETGVGIAEVYDLDSASTAQLANISTRGFVNTGDNVMIGGFIVSGTEPTSVLVRAIGPSLTAFGVQGALPATTLELHDSNGAVISNEGWRNTQEADIVATGLQPSNDNEAAILATLVPGSYTAVVRGKDNTTGIGLVEAYNLQ